MFELGESPANADFTLPTVDDPSASRLTLTGRDHFRPSSTGGSSGQGSSGAFLIVTLATPRLMRSLHIPAVTVSTGPNITEADATSVRERHGLPRPPS